MSLNSDLFPTQDEPESGLGFQWSMSLKTGQRYRDQVLSGDVSFLGLSGGEVNPVRRRGPRGEKWETGFRFSTFPSGGPPELWECGNLAPWARFPRGGGRVGNPPLVFHAFLRPGISTAPVVAGWPARSHFIPRHFFSNASLTRCIRCAASVSLILRACRSSSAAVMPSFKYCSQSGSETNSSYGVR